MGGLPDTSVLISCVDICLLLTLYTGSRLTLRAPPICVDVHFLKLHKTCVTALIILLIP